MVSRKFAVAQQNKKKGAGFTPKANEIEKKKLEAKKKQVFEEASDDDEDEDDMEFDEESDFDEDDSDEGSDEMGDDSEENAINTSAKNSKSPGGKALFTIDKTPSKQTPGKQLAKQTPGKQLGKQTPGKQTPSKTPQARTPGKGQNKSLLSAKASQLKQQEADDDDDDEDEDDDDDDDDDEEAVVMTGKNVKSPAALGNRTPGKQQVQGKTPQRQTPSTAQKLKSSTPAGVLKSRVQEDDDDDEEEEDDEDEEDEEDSEEDEELTLDVKGGKNTLVNNKTAGKQQTPSAPGKQVNQKQQLKSVSFEEDSDDDEDDEEEDDEDDDDDDEEDEDEEEEDEVPKKGKQSAGGAQKQIKQENATAYPEGEKQNKRLYIGNLPEGTTVANVKALSADIIDVILPVKKGKAFYAFAVFDSVEKVDQNYKLLQGAVLKGNALRIDYCGDKSSKASPSKQASGGGDDDDSRFDKSAIFLKDIPEGVLLMDLATVFPDARFADIYTIKATNQRNAVVRFSSPDDGIKYMEKSKTVSLKGKDVEINFKFLTGQGGWNNDNRGQKRPFEGNRFGGSFRGGKKFGGNFQGQRFGGRGNFQGQRFGGRGNFQGQRFGGGGGGNQDNFKRQKW